MFQVLWHLSRGILHEGLLNRGDINENVQNRILLKYIIFTI